jgi:hypothetical protein
MKKHIFIIIMGFGALNAKSQKLEKPRVDKITGSVSIATKEQVLANKFTLIGHYLACHIIKGQGYCLLYFHLKDGLDIRYHMLKGDVATIKFADGELLEIKASDDARSSLIPYATPPVTESFIPFDLTDDDVSALKTGKISVIRITTSKGLFDYDVSDGKAEVIKKQLELIYGK